MMSSSHPSTRSVAETTVSEVADGIVRIDLPVPFRGLRQVNMWLLRDGDGWTMVDCGYGDPLVRVLLESAWADVLGGRPVTRLFVTHFHPDHIGNCRFVCERWGILPTMTQLEWMSANLAVGDGYTDDIQARTAFYRRHGLDETRLARFVSEVVPYSEGVAIPGAYRRIDHGSTLRIGGDDWHVLTGGGHSPDLAGLFSPARQIYIAGDQVLPKITTNVSVWPVEPESDPLAEFIASLARIETAITGAVTVLPSHGEPFKGLHQRIAALRQHHHHRLTLLLTFIIAQPGPTTAGECLDHLFRGQLDGHQLGFAMGEAIAHFNHLANLGKIKRQYSGETVRFHKN